MIAAIACVYPDGQMSTTWFQFCRRLRVEARRAGFSGRIDLVRRGDIAEDIDVLAVVPAMFDAVEQEYGKKSMGSGVRRVVPLAADDKAGLAEFVKWLAAESPSTSNKEHGTTLAVHRGFQKVGSRVISRASGH
jgi:hypothetical protein